jgi:hypothetical protein
MSVNLEELYRLILRGIDPIFASQVMRLSPNQVFISCFTLVQMMIKKYSILYAISRSWVRIAPPEFHNDIGIGLCN